jgi:hypothetical protein
MVGVLRWSLPALVYFDFLFFNSTNLEPIPTTFEIDVERENFSFNHRFFLISSESGLKLYDYRKNGGKIFQEPTSPEELEDLANFF